MTEMGETLTVKEAAAILNVQPATLYSNWRKWGIPGFRLGGIRTGRIRFHEVDFRAWMESLGLREVHRQAKREAALKAEVDRRVAALKKR